MAGKESGGRRAAIEAQGVEFIANMVEMRGRPIDARAPRAVYEACLRRQDVRRDDRRHLLFGYRDQWHIAPNAARKQAGRRGQLVGRNDLPELLAKMIAFDVQQRWTLPHAQQAPVACQDDAPLGACVAHQGLAGQVRSIGRIAADQAQPRRQSTEHLVDSETWSGHDASAVNIIRKD